MVIFLLILFKIVPLYYGSMGESFQDYSWIKDFEADFPQKVSLKMLNLGDHNSFYDLFSVCLLKDMWSFKLGTVNI